GDKFLIDAEDVDVVSRYWWYKKADSDYVIADIKAHGKLIKRLRLHRLLLGVEDDIFVVDHINRNPLDCRKSNLRVATQHQNCINKGIRSSNTLGYIGVKKRKNGMYEANITLDGQQIILGKSHDAVTCAQMYNVGAQCLFRQFAGQLNCVSEPPLWIEFQVWKKCRPYTDLANRITNSQVCS
ncbi:HNH endonuclease, partial [Selenomonas sp. CM52]|uniref:HNH endonuclease n=1 Tax=Selenomonas sp. CM52 TaxID=936381 RepID=UPI0008FAE3EC